MFHRTTIKEALPHGITLSITLEVTYMLWGERENLLLIGPQLNFELLRCTLPWMEWKAMVLSFSMIHLSSEQNQSGITTSQRH